MPHFGNTLRALRESRRLSQDKLAEAAVVSKMTILRAEGMAKCSLRRTTLMAVLEALEKERGLSTAEEAAWVADTGIGPMIEMVRRTIKDQHIPVPGRDAESQAHASVSRLSQIHGAHRILALLESLEAIAGNLPNSRTFDINVVHPPVNRPGYTEQVISHYDRESPQAAEVRSHPQAAKKHKRA